MYDQSHGGSSSTSDQNWQLSHSNANPSVNSSDVTAQTPSRMGQDPDTRGPYPQTSTPMNAQSMPPPGFPQPEIPSPAPYSPPFNLQFGTMQSMYHNFPMTPMQPEASGVDRYTPDTMGRKQEDVLSHSLLNILSHDGGPFTPAKLNFNDADADSGSASGTASDTTSMQNLSTQENRNMGPAGGGFYGQFGGRGNAQSSYEKPMYDMGMPYVPYGVPNMFMPVPFSYDYGMQQASSQHQQHTSRLGPQTGAPDEESSNAHYSNHPNAGVSSVGGFQDSKSDSNMVAVGNPDTANQGEIAQNSGAPVGHPGGNIRPATLGSGHPFGSSSDGMMGFPHPLPLSGAIPGAHPFFQQFFPGPFGNYFPPSIAPGMMLLPPPTGQTHAPHLMHAMGGGPQGRPSDFAGNAVDHDEEEDGEDGALLHTTSGLPLGVGGEAQVSMPYLVTRGIPMNSVGYYVPPQAQGTFGQGALDQQHLGDAASASGAENATADTPGSDSASSPEVAEPSQTQEEEAKPARDAEFFDKCIAAYQMHLKAEEDRKTKEERIMPPLPPSQFMNYDCLVVLSHMHQVPGRYVIVSVLGPKCLAAPECVALFRRGYTNSMEYATMATRPIALPTVRDILLKGPEELDEIAHTSEGKKGATDSGAGAIPEKDAAVAASAAPLEDAAVPEADLTIIRPAQSDIYDTKGRQVSLRQYKLTLPPIPGEYEVVVFGNRDVSASVAGRSRPLTLHPTTLDLPRVLHSFRADVRKPYLKLALEEAEAASKEQAQSPIPEIESMKFTKKEFKKDPKSGATSPTVATDDTDSTAAKSELNPVWDNALLQREASKPRGQERLPLAFSGVSQSTYTKDKVNRHATVVPPVKELQQTFAIAAGVLDLCGAPVLPALTPATNASSFLLPGAGAIGTAFSLSRNDPFADPRSRAAHIKPVKQVDFSTFAQAETALRTDVLASELVDVPDLLDEPDVEQKLRKDLHTLLRTFAKMIQTQDNGRDGEGSPDSTNKDGVPPSIPSVFKSGFPVLFDQLQFLLSIVKNLSKYPIAPDVCLDVQGLSDAVLPTLLCRDSDDGESGPVALDVAPWVATFQVQKDFASFLWSLLAHFRYTLLLIQGYFTLKHIQDLKVTFPTPTAFLHLWTFKFETSPAPIMEPYPIEPDAAPVQILSLLSGVHNFFYDILVMIESNPSMREILSAPRQALLALWKSHCHPITKIFMPTQLELQDVGISIALPTGPASLRRFFSRFLYYYYKHVIVGAEVTAFIVNDATLGLPLKSDLLAPIHVLLRKVGKDLQILPPDLLPFERMQDVGEVFASLTNSPTSKDIFDSTHKEFTKFLQSLPLVVECRSKILGLLLEKYGTLLCLDGAPFTSLDEEQKGKVYDLLEECIRMQCSSIQNSFDINHLWCVMDVNLVFDKDLFFETVKTTNKLKPLVWKKSNAVVEPTVEEKIADEIYEILLNTDLVEIIQNVDTTRFIFEHPYNDLYFLKDFSNNVNLYLKLVEPDAPNAVEFTESLKNSKPPTVVLSVASLIFAWFLRLSITCSIDDITRYVMSIYGNRHLYYPTFDLIPEDHALGALLVCVFWVLYTDDISFPDSLQIYQDANLRVIVDNRFRGFRNRSILRKDIIGTTRSRAGIVYALLTAGAAEWDACMEFIRTSVPATLEDGDVQNSTKKEDVDAASNENTDAALKGAGKNPYFPFIKGITRYFSNAQTKVSHPLEAIWINLQQASPRKQMQRRFYESFPTRKFVIIPPPQRQTSTHAESLAQQQQKPADRVPSRAAPQLSEGQAQQGQEQRQRAVRDNRVASEYTKRPVASSSHLDTSADGASQDIADVPAHPHAATSHHHHPSYTRGPLSAGYHQRPVHHRPFHDSTTHTSGYPYSKQPPHAYKPYDYLGGAGGPGGSSGDVDMSRSRGYPYPYASGPGAAGYGYPGGPRYPAAYASRPHPQLPQPHPYSRPPHTAYGYTGHPYTQQHPHAAPSSGVPAGSFGAPYMVNPMPYAPPFSTAVGSGNGGSSIGGASAVVGNAGGHDSAHTTASPSGGPAGTYAVAPRGGYHTPAIQPALRPGGYSYPNHSYPHANLNHVPGAYPKPHPSAHSNGGMPSVADNMPYA